MSATPLASSPGVSARMSAQRRLDTRPELALRRLLHASGCRYRVQWRTPLLPRRSIDVAFPGRRVAVFVDGCFWHGCPEHGTQPKANGVWWSAKLRRNRERDADTDQVLRDAGWTVLRIWEHEPPELAAVRVRDTLTKIG